MRAALPARMVPLQAVTVPAETDDETARRLLAGVLLEADDFDLSVVDGLRAFRPGGSG